MLDFTIIALLGLSIGWFSNWQLGKKARLSSDLAAGLVGAIISALLVYAEIFHVSTKAAGSVFIFAVPGAFMAVFLQRMARSKRTR